MCGHSKKKVKRKEVRKRKMGFRVIVKKGKITAPIRVKGKSVGFNTAGDVRREFARQKRKSKALKGVTIVSISRVGVKRFRRKKSSSVKRKTVRRRVKRSKKKR